MPAVNSSIIDKIVQCVVRFQAIVVHTLDDPGCQNNSSSEAKLRNSLPLARSDEGFQSDISTER